MTLRAARNRTHTRLAQHFLRSGMLRSYRGRFGLTLFCAAAVLSLAGCTSTGAERVLFFPTAAHLDEKQENWVVPIEGWVYVPKRGRILRNWGFNWLASKLGLKKDEEYEAARKIFEARADSFIVDGKPGRVLFVHIGDERHMSPPTDSAGRFGFEIKLPAEKASELAEDNRIQYRARRKTLGGTYYFLGHSLLVGPTGVSVISDIDDTIKISNITVKGEMVRSMFIREFQPVPGMAEIYRRWAAEEGAIFHYVSGSPSQLFTALSEFVRRERFPDQAVFALKRIGWFDSFMSNLWKSARVTKPPVIRRILDDFPDRDFILVGDSGEHDPEVYAEAAREHPDQVLHIYIRDVTGDQPDGERYRQAFKDVPRWKWTIFSDAAELQPIDLLFAIRERETGGQALATDGREDRRPEAAR